MHAAFATEHDSVFFYQLSWELRGEEHGIPLFVSSFGQIDFFSLTYYAPKWGEGGKEIT